MIYGGILVFGALAFASWRALAFHAVSSHAYRQWLAATPWTGNKPLPLGPKQEDLLLLILGVVFFMAPMLRLFVYANGYLPPISVLGRLATFRWIIPGYDQIFVAPLLAFMAGSALEVTGTLLGVDPLIGRPVAIAVILSMCLGLGPSLKTWRLTGNHRIAITTLRAETVRVG